MSVWLEPETIAALGEPKEQPMTDPLLERVARAICSGNGDPDSFTGEVSPTAMRDARVALQASGLQQLRDRVEELKCDIADAIRQEENPVKSGDDYATGFNNGLRLARRVSFAQIDKALSQSKEAQDG